MDNEQLESSDGGQYEHLRIKIIEALREEGNISRACKSIALSRSTFYLWMQDTSFAEQASQALTLSREERIDKLEDAIMDQALGVFDEENGKWISKPNPISQIFALKALTRQSTTRVWSDAPPPEIKAPEDKDPASLTDTNQDKLKALMEEFIIKLPPATPEEGTSKPSDS